MSRIHMAESLIPSDLTTPTTGSNYGLDGYEDMQYGMGVLEGVTNPDFSPPPALPTGLSKGAAEHLDLGSVVSEGPINDLSWLSDFEPDPARLPDKPRTLNSVPDLQRIWGGNRAMTQRSAHAVDLAVLRDRGEVANAVAKSAGCTEIARRASRRVHANTAPDDIAREAMAAAAGDVSAIRGVIDAVEKDRGLAGNVFVRASAFPGYDQGKWKSFVKQHARNAKYLLVDERTLKNATWIQDGRCVYTGKQAVTSIPWGDAYAHYAPRLKAAGYVVSDGPDYRKALKTAFLSGPVSKTPGTNLPSHDGAIKLLGASSLDSEAAARAFEARRVRSLHERVAKIKTRVKAGEKGAILRKRIASLFAPSEAAEAVRLLSPFIKEALQDTTATVRTADVVATVSEVRPLNTPAAIDAEGVLASLHGRRASSIQSRVDAIKARIDKGESGELLRRRVASMFGPSEQKLAAKLLAPIIRDALHDKPAEIRIARDTNERFVNIGPKNSEELAFAKKASAGVDKIAAVRKAVGWVRRAMNEGFAGKNLDDAIHHRFTEALLKEAEANIRSVRAAHEGLAGFRYIDASVYASKDGGVKGCENGGLKHRANQVKLLLAMDKCASCSLANALPDGNRRCSVYGKVLVAASDLNGEELRKAKSEAIRLANASDAETTASLFAPKFDPGEFGLHNNALDNIRPDELPEQNKIDDIVLGGLVF